MLERVRIVPALVLLGLFGQIAGSPCAGEVVRFVNGRWLGAEGFVEREVYSVDGLLASTAPAGAVRRVVDLAGGFVVPAFGEAHNHNLRRPATPEGLRPYVEQGIFYVMIQGNLPNAPSAAASPVQVLYSNGGITAPEGHLVEVNERLAGYGVFGDVAVDELDGFTHYEVDQHADLERQWPVLLATGPDFVKVFLGFSGEGPEGRESDLFGRRGLRPELVEPILERARAAGLRVSAHIETAADFRLALESGVDLVAHLPGWRVGGEAGYSDFDERRWLLTNADARLAAAARTPIATTTLAGEAMKDPEHADHERVRAIQRHNVTILHEAGARLVIGSDYYGGTSLDEVHMLARSAVVEDGLVPLGVLDNETLLRLWSEETPRALLPNRAVGSLEDGSEASFVVLAGDPIRDLSQVRRIRQRWSRGKPVP